MTRSPSLLEVTFMVSRFRIPSLKPRPWAQAIRNLPLLALFPGMLSSCARFPEADFAAVLRDRSATYITDSAGTEFSRYYGYGTGDCAHPGAHALFPVAGTYPIYAALDGVVSQVDDCSTAGTNDKFDITLAVGRVGAVAIYLDYSLEPFGGRTCSTGGAGFSSQILVTQGQQVKKGDVIARMVAVGSAAHVHFNLKVDGATLCPEIFPSSVISALTPSSSVTAGCAALHVGGSLCVQPTSSEDPRILGR